MLKGFFKYIDCRKRESRTKHCATIFFYVNFKGLFGTVPKRWRFAPHFSRRSDRQNRRFSKNRKFQKQPKLGLLLPIYYYLKLYFIYIYKKKNNKLLDVH